MLEPLVLKNDDIAGIKLLFEYRGSGHSSVIGHVIEGVEVGIRTIANPVDDVDDDELFIVMMWFRHDVREGPEKVHPECAVGLPPARRHQPKESMQQLDSLTVLHELDARVFTLARNVRPVADGDRVVAIQVEITVAPLVLDNVPGSLAVYRPIAVIVAERPRIEVRVTEVLPELLGEPDRPVAG
jgi:hypothetical protein